MQNRPAPPATAALVDAHRDGAEAATGLIEQAVAPNTRDAYVGAVRRLNAWLDGRPLDDRSLAAYLGSLHKAGRTPATAALVVAAVRRAAHDANENAPDGPLTRQTLEGFRRTAAAAGAPAHRSLARGLTAEECDAVLAACCRRRRTGRGLEREETAMRRGLIDAAIVALLFHGALRRSEVAALRWADVDLSDDDDDVVVVVARRRTRPATGPTSGGWSAAAPPRSADCTPRRRRRRPRRSSAWPSTRSTAGSPPPAPRPDSKDAGPRTAAASDSPSSSPHAGPAPTTSRSPADGRTPAWSRATPAALVPGTARYAGSCDRREPRRR